MRPLKSILFLILFGTAVIGQARADENPERYKVLPSKDSLAFDAAMDRCDVRAMEGLFPEDFGFYYDKEGYTRGREVFMDPARQNGGPRRAVWGQTMRATPWNPQRKKENESIVREGQGKNQKGHWAMTTNNRNKSDPRQNKEFIHQSSNENH